MKGLQLFCTLSWFLDLVDYSEKYTNLIARYNSLQIYASIKYNNNRCTNGVEVNNLTTTYLYVPGLEEHLGQTNTQID